MTTVHNVRMEPKDRLQQAIKEGGYAGPTEAWSLNKRTLGISKDLVISNANGNRPISRKTAAAYAKAFGHSPGWYLYGTEETGDLDLARAMVEIPLISSVAASRLKEQEGVSPADVERYLHADDLPAGDWVALTVEGTSMDRLAPDGSVIIINRADSTLLDGRYYVFSVDNGAATFKTYRRNPERLQPFSTNPDHMSIPVTGDTDLYVFGRVRRVIQDV